MSFSYTYSGPYDIQHHSSCTGSGTSSPGNGATAPITAGAFTLLANGPWSGFGSGVIRGTFDSPSSAHGTATFYYGAFCPYTAGGAATFNWTAAPR